MEEQPTHHQLRPHQPHKLESSPRQSTPTGRTSMPDPRTTLHRHRHPGRPRPTDLPRRRRRITQPPIRMRALPQRKDRPRSSPSESLMPRRNRRPPAPEPFGITSIAKLQTQAQPEHQRHPRRLVPGYPSQARGQLCDQNQMLTARGGCSDLRIPPVGEVPGTPTALPVGAGYGLPAFQGARQ